jgi:predicted ATP-binding protein involved in virulence
MKLKSVKIRNFRAIGTLDLDLDSHLTVLIGENAAGKTCVLDAIALALRPLVERVRTKGGGAPIGGVAVVRTPPDIRRIEGVPAVFAAVQVETPDGLRWERRLLRDLTRQTRDIASNAFLPVATTGLHNALDPVIAARGAGDLEAALPVAVFYGTDRGVVSERSFLLGSRAAVETEWYNAYNGALRPAAHFHTMATWFEQVEADELRHRRDEDPTWSHPQLTAVRAAVESVVPGARKVRVSARRRLEVTLAEADGHDEVLALNELSGGYRTLLALVADLARRMAQANPTLGTDSEAIVLIDEVDLHLHPKWQQTVLDSLRRAFPNAQFIVTTHSEQVIAAVEPKHIVRLDRVSDGVAASRPTSTYGATPDRISEDVMGVPHLRPARVEDTLKSYWALINDGAGETEAALTLRATLDGWFQGEDPEMIRADAEVKRQKMLRKLRGTP